MISISQPTFFPWIGYFDLIDQSDAFVILNDVQFTKQSWQQRNNFKCKTGLTLFTVPVISNKKDKQINEILIFNPNRSKKKFYSFLISNYSKAKYFNEYFELYVKKFNEGADSEKLNTLNENIILFTLSLLNIKTKIYFSSDFKIKDKKSEKIIKLCEELNYKKYLSSDGAKDYLVEDKSLFLKKNIEVLIHRYNHPNYNQLYPPFCSYTCVLDLIMNEGENSLKIIQSGRKKNKILF
jgi:hypothetical protein